MANEQLAALIAGFIVTHGLASATVAWKLGKYLVDRLVEWKLMQVKVEQLERELKEFKSEQSKTNDQIFRDIKGVSIKADARNK